MKSETADADTSLTSAIKTDEKDLRLSQLVASYSLLDPDRRGSRRDVVISTLVAVLAERQPITSNHLFGAIRSMWKTSTLTQEILTAALVDAQAAGLVVEREENGKQYYYTSSDAAAETEQDRLYLVHLLEAFQNQAAERLDEYSDADELLKRQDKVVAHILTALAIACQGTYAIDAPGTSKSVRPMSVSQSAALQYINQIQPKSLRLPVKNLTLDALDTEESFGNEIVHLIVVSGLLLGLTAQRGVSDTPSLDNTMIILDTSVLVGLVKPGDNSERMALDELISLSDRCDAKLIVPQHTVEEWNRVWEGADGEMEESGDRVGTITSEVLTNILGNPFIASYSEYLSCGGEHNWMRWSRTRRSLPALLQSLPVTVEEYTEQTPRDGECYDLLLATLTRMSKDKDIPGWRNKASAEADAKTATMITRWRNRYGESRAVFVANESLTNRAYAECFPESKPLVIRPTIWLQYVGCLIVDDPLLRIEIADLIADIAVRNTVLSLAGAHTLEEVLSFSDMLTREGISPSAQLVRDLEDPLLFESAESLQQESDGAFLLRAQTVIARRGTRSNQRAANREARLQSQFDSMQKIANDRSAEADTQRSRAESEEQRANEATQDREELAEENLRLHRVIHAGIASTIALVLLVALISWGLLGWIAILLGIVGAGLGILYAYQWVGRVDSKPSRMWISASCQVVWHIVLSIVF